ncbi:FAS1-like dehydratase domain-containing protein [Bosea rubneri]|uniref:MaoC family dehydratase N-terminal domain-containing protein n=1 Tax=Bosea rubneri TaxID=3075434 RepID=A0ABU3SBQ9_9HYPH|nr:MaoC family dehydratase N-terminal domain-containing protein [Bosea sp. ZW T0_25]MDU0342220.1 MaoC family dehydratase N-terminal domain-containing protein [Bosea sp. ZW T0_25]
MNIDQLKSWIGKTEEASDLVTPRLVASYAATFAPHLAPYRQGEAPLALHWCLAPPIAPMAALGEDGHPAKGGFLPPIPLPRRMWAGGTIETIAPLQTGDDVTRRSRIADIAYKEGRSGPLCFVAVDHELVTPRGLALRERHNIVYREAAQSGAEPASPAPAEPRPAELTWTVEASPVLLFRYSALTFNGHRIHYDEPYVTGVEGYAGLVVHGPIQATLIMNIIATLSGGEPIRLDYRGLAPLIAGEPFVVKAKRLADGAIAAWTEGADGRVRMEGVSR